MSQQSTTSTPADAGFTPSSSSDRTLLESGGLVGALVGGLLGGSSNAADGYSTVQGLRSEDQRMRVNDDTNRRSEEAHKAQQIVAYQNIRGKTLELKEAQMDLKVREIKQAGLEADAKLQTDRYVNMLKHTDDYKGLDDDQIRSKVTESVKAATSQELEFVNQASRSPLVESEAGYKVLKERADRAGVSMDALGLPEKWTPRTATQWRATAGYSDSVRQSQAAVIAQQQKDTQELKVEALKSDKTLTSVAMQVESAERIAQLKANTEAVKAQAKAAADAKGTVDARDLGYEGYEVGKLKNTNTIRTIIPGWSQGLSEVKAGNEIDKAAGWLDREVERRLRVSALNYTGGPAPKTYPEVVEELIPKMVSQIGRDGTFYENSDNPKLKADRKAFGEQVLAGASSNEKVTNTLTLIANEVYSMEGKSEKELEAIFATEVGKYMSKLYGSPAARGLQTGTSEFVKAPIVNKNPIGRAANG